MPPFSIHFPLPIITPRLLIRAPLLNDDKLVNNAIIESFCSLHPFMPWAFVKPTLDDTACYIRACVANWILKKSGDPWLLLLIFDKLSGDFIGTTGFHQYNWDVPCLETGYWIHDAHAGCGLMTEAINALTQYAFKQLSVKRIAITCDIDNLRSKKIPERLHYTLEGILKSNRIKPDNGNISDTVIYARYNLDNLPSLPVSWDN